MAQTKYGHTDSEGNFQPAWQQTDEELQAIFDSTPGGIDAKLSAVAAAGPGLVGATQWAQSMGMDVSGSGVGVAAQQAMNDTGGIGGAIGKYVGPLIKPAVAAGTAVLGGLAAAPYLGAGTGAAAGTEAVGAAGAAPAATSVGGAAGGAIESALSTAAIPGGGIGAATGAGGASSALGAAGAAGAGLAGLSPSEIGMEGSANWSPSEIGMEGGGALGGGALAAGAVGGGGVLSSLANGAAGGAAGAAAGSATSGGLSNTLGSIMGDDDWLKILGRGLPGILGAVGSASQAEDYEDLANKYMEMGSPYRTKLQQLYGDPSAFLNSPEVRQPIQQGTDMLARSLSVKGNPAGSGNALQELQNYASTQLFNKLGQEKDRLGGFGGLTQYNQAAPQAAQNVIGAQGDVYSNLGGAAADIFNPPKRYSLQDFLRY